MEKGCGLDMKALCIRQPWAWAIIYGGKDIENRTWKTGFRGRFLVHASKIFDEEGWIWLAQNENRLGLKLPYMTDFQRGGILGSVELVDCVSNHSSRWFFGPFGFVLKGPTALPFKPCNGKLRFFEI